MTPRGAMNVQQADDTRRTGAGAAGSIRWLPHRSGSLRGVALVVHGLNLKPERMVLFAPAISLARVGLPHPALLSLPAPGHRDPRAH